MADFVIRDAVAGDLAAINSIYNYYVKNSTCTYQTEDETYEARCAWFTQHTAEYPVIVAEKAGRVTGWGALSRYHARAAYKPTVENSVYVVNDCRGRGIGTLLLKELITRAKALGYHSIIAGISADQSASIALHAKMHFVQAAHLKEVGYKFNSWLDVVLYQLML